MGKFERIKNNSIEFKAIENDIINIQKEIINGLSEEYNKVFDKLFKERCIILCIPIPNANDKKEVLEKYKVFKTGNETSYFYDDGTSPMRRIITTVEEEPQLPSMNELLSREIKMNLIYY